MAFTDGCGASALSGTIFDEESNWREIVSKMKTIGVANGGGDAPGLNAVIRGVVRSAIHAHGMRVVQAARAIGTTFGDSA